MLSLGSRPIKSSIRLTCGFAVVALYLALQANPASAQTADTVLFNGKILTVDKDFSIEQALAIGHGQVLASGTTAAMKKLAGDGAKLIDLGGRTVIPGLTDGHIHGVRAALTFGTEVNWIGVPTLKEALEKIRQAGKTQKPGSWIVVAGGWTGGVQTRGDAEAPSRRQALEMYTRNSAFMANDDDKRGTLEPGKFADLAVLSSDYLTAPVKEVGKIRSVMTMVGGEVVYADQPFAKFASGASR
jgi:predicted amidohydrolase YtcJ